MKQKIPLSKIPITTEVKKATLEVIESGNFILGKKTKEFENKFAKLCRGKLSSCVNSGTTAIFLALKSLGVEKGDEVIVPSLSFIASATPILMVGAKPKFVDVDEKSFTINPDALEKNITKKTKGIIPVHLYGHPADMDKINKIAKKHSLFVLEDAAQAHGAKYKGRYVGSIGDVSCFSFYPSKNLTVCGDGGIVVSNNKKIIDQIKILRDHGRKEKYIHDILGYNLRFNEIQAAIGLAMLKNLEKNNSKRRKIARAYTKILKDVVDTPKEEKWAKHVFHMYTIRTPNRDILQNELKKYNISTGIHYPVPIHKQPLFSKYKNEKLPITENICNTTLSLPMYPELSIKNAEFVGDTVKKILTNLN